MNILTIRNTVVVELNISFSCELPGSQGKKGNTIACAILGFIKEKENQFCRREKDLPLYQIKEQRKKLT